MEHINRYSLAQGEQAKLVNRIRNYLYNEVLGDMGLYIEDDWCKEEYIKIFNVLKTPWKNSCSLTNGQENFGDVLLNNMTWLIKIPDANYTGQAVFDQFVNTLELPEVIFNRLKNCIDNQKEHSVVFVIFEWETHAHATMLYFDLQNMCQCFFDPDDGKDVNLSLTKGMSQKAFIPDFSVVEADLLLEETYAECIQRVFEQVNNFNPGVCGILLFLVLVCCLRFDYWDTKRMCRFIQQATNLQADINEGRNDNYNAAADLMHKLIFLFDYLYENQFDPDIIRQTFLDPPRVGKSLCGVFSSNTHTICKRKTENNEQYCWQHKQKLLV